MSASYQEFEDLVEPLVVKVNIMSQTPEQEGHLLGPFPPFNKCSISSAPDMFFTPIFLSLFTFTNRNIASAAFFLSDAPRKRPALLGPISCIYSIDPT